MNGKLSILIIDSERTTASELKTAFEFKGYVVYVASTAIIARSIILKHSPHLIILDIVLSDMDGFEFVKELKENIMFQNIPVLILTGRNTLEERIRGLQIGADDYVGKPFDLAEVLARVGTIIKRNYYSLDANPLSRLPGNLSIVRTVEDHLMNKRLIAIAYFDLDNFKAFNDVYGFSMGDEVIKHTAKVILSAVHDYGNENDFVGHIGGDDFICISTPDKIDAICLGCLKNFDKTIISFYTPEDQQRRKIVVEDRRGKLDEFPIMSISAATLTNQYKQIKHIGQINAITAELKKYAKSFKGSCYVKDRRDQDGEGTALVFGGLDETDDERIGQKEEEKYVKEFERILRERDIRVLFQPILDIAHDTIIGHEAFCRGPSGGFLENPNNLFRIARKIGKVQKLDQLCREKVLSVSRSLKESLLLFINIWPESLQDPQFQSDKFLKHIGRDPGSIIFEIGGMDNPTTFELYHKAVRFFQEKGFKIAIDNVGEGKVLGLGIIAELKPAFVKLDISLMRGIHQDPVKQQTLRAFMAVFKQVKINVIAEKVELDEEFTFIKNIGIEFVQGYLFAKPERID